MNDRLLIHVPISNRAWALPDFLRGLLSQQVPDTVRTIQVVFDVNDSQDETAAILRRLDRCFDGRGFVEVRERDVDHIDADEHEWPAERLRRMTTLRNGALTDLLRTGARYLFSMDSDVILTEPDTLAHLLSLDVPIVAGVFFTTWGRQCAQALPNVWQSGRNEMTDVFLQNLRTPSHQIVGGLGACTLIRRDVAEAGVTYSRVYNAPADYDGEDRHFGLRAAVAGFILMACTCKRIVHLDKGWNDPKDVLPWAAR